VESASEARRLLVTAPLDKDEVIRRRKRRQRLATIRAQQDGFQVAYDAGADALQVQLDELLAIEEPSPEEAAAIASLTATIESLRASAARIRAELAGGLP
jgi:hypothetical protein